MTLKRNIFFKLYIKVQKYLYYLSYFLLFMVLVPKSITVDKEKYELFRKECDKRAMSFSKWLRNVMDNQLSKWDNKY